VPPNIHELPMKFETKVPIEGVGVVHVTTKPEHCRFDHLESDVVLWRYSGHMLEERVSLTGTTCSASGGGHAHLLV
jgi:hypothetical protein